MARLIPPKEKIDRRSQYPWNEWLVVGTTWELKRGEDFNVSAASFENLARLTAKHRNTRISVLRRDGGDTIIIQNLGPLAGGKSATRRK